MTMLGLTVSMEMRAKANAPRRFGHVLRAEENPVRIALNFVVRGKRKSTRKGKVKEIRKKFIGRKRMLQIALSG